MLIEPSRTIGSRKEFCYSRYTLGWKTSIDGAHTEYNNNRRDGTMSNSSSTENITDLANIEIPVDDDNNNNASSWIDICHDRTYIPSEMDVGHPLRVTASAISEQTGEILAGPIILQTNPCLEAPEIHPRRKVAAMSGMPNTGGFSFRILSYKSSR